MKMEKGKGLCQHQPISTRVAFKGIRVDCGLWIVDCERFARKLKKRVNGMVRLERGLIDLTVERQEAGTRPEARGKRPEARGEKNF